MVQTLLLAPSPRGTAFLGPVWLAGKAANGLKSKELVNET